MQSDLTSFDDPVASVYNTIFNIGDISEKLVPPPIEVNNAKWQYVKWGQTAFSTGTAVARAQVTQSVNNSFGDASDKSAQVLESVYGDDFQNIDARCLGERLKLVTGFLNAIEKNPAKKLALLKKFRIFDLSFFSIFGIIRLKFLLGRATFPKIIR